jgi:hypothetical protein
VIVCLGAASLAPKCNVQLFIVGLNMKYVCVTHEPTLVYVCIDSGILNNTTDCVIKTYLPTMNGFSKVTSSGSHLAHVAYSS